jgi:nucleotide-binding universal stress UspA family protein
MAGHGEPWTLRRVLCATDFSDNAASALDAAVALARPTNARVVILHVKPLAPPPGSAPTCWPAPAHGAAHETRADAISQLERFARPAVAAGVETERVLEEGDPCEQILRKAEHAEADLIVMGRHSRARDHWFLGSVAEHVVARAPCPVLVVKPFPLHRGRRTRQVICGLDLGETAAATLARAAGLARALDAELLVLHATPGTAPDAVRLAHSKLDALVADASLPSDRVRKQVVAGTPDEQIAAAADRDNGAQRLVVVGSHGGGVRDRQFIGSTALHLLRGSGCDVLVVPAPVLPAEESQACPPEAVESRRPPGPGRA